MEIINKVKKLQGGGIPAFVGYTNVPQPMPSAPYTEGSNNVESTKDKAEGIDKSLLQALYKEGLISDVDAVASEVSNLFANRNNPLDPNSTATAYRRTLQLMVRLREGKEQWKMAIEESKKNGSYGEMAVSTDGRYYVMGEDGPELKSTLERGDRVLTNADLAELRANNVPFANNISTTIANGVSMESINKTIWELISKIGKDSTSKEFFRTKKGQDIKDGIDELLAAGEDGVYKITEKSTDQSRKAVTALNYLISVMPTNAKALLRGKAALAGLDPNKGAYKLVADMVASGIDNTSEIGIDFDKAATTGANTDSNGNKKTLSMKPIMSYYSGENGVESTYIVNPGQGYQMHTDAVIYGMPLDQKGDVVPQGSLQSLLNSGIGGIVDTTSISLGNQRVDSSNLGQVLYDGTQLARAILPYTYDANGKIVPDFELMPEFIEAQKEIKERGNNITAVELSQILNTHNLGDYMYQNKDGELIWNPSKFRPFLMTNVIAGGSDSWIGGKSGVIDVDKAGEGYMTNIRSMPEVDPDNIKNLFKGKLGITPESELFRTVAYMPILESAGLALNVAGEDPTIPADWGDMRIIKGKAAQAKKLSTFTGASTSKLD
jgi:hypothetical protein